MNSPVIFYTYNVTDMYKITTKIENVSIFIETSIEGMTEPIILTNNNLFYDRDFFDDFDLDSEYPYFIDNRRFPKDLLANKKYEEKVSFFFHRRSFLNIMENIMDENTVEDDIIQYNINTLIELLFPIKYPIANDNSDSYGIMINKNKNNKYSLIGTIPSFIPFIPESLKNRFSYLKIGEKKYTVTSTCVLNDFINNPIYKKFLNNFIDFEKWFTHTTSEIEEEFIAITDSIDGIIRTKYSRFEDIKKEIKDSFKSDEDFLTNKVNDPFITKMIDVLQLFHTKYDLLNKEDKIQIGCFDTEFANIKALFFISDKYWRGYRNKNYFYDLKNSVDEIINLQKTYDIYFKFESKTSDKDLEKYLKNKFKKYSDFLNEVKSIVKPNRISNNKKMQKMIDDYAKRKNNLFPQYLLFLNDRHIKHDLRANLTHEIKTMYDIDNESSLYIGVNINYRTDIKYEAYVAFSLIDGELNDNNMKKISCNYKNEELGTLLKNHKKMKKIKKSIVYLKELFNEKNDREEPVQVKKGGRKRRLQKVNQTLRIKKKKGRYTRNKHT
jgi:hypothetical protein